MTVCAMCHHDVETYYRTLFPLKHGYYVHLCPDCCAIKKSKDPDMYILAKLEAKK